MSHEITSTDSLLLRRHEAWHGLGRVIEDDLSAVQACTAAGLDWEVNPWPIWAENPVTGERFRVETHFANVREIQTPEGAIPQSLGVVGRGYKVCQNRELAEFVDALQQTGEVVTETCGSIRGGKNVWFLLRGDAYDFGGDQSFSYLLAANAHDGSRAIELVPTDIRVVCRNTLSAVIGDLDTGDWKGAAIRVNHTGELSRKLDEARVAIREYRSICQRSRDLYGRLADTPVGEDAAVEYFSGQYAAAFQAWDGTGEKKQQTRLKNQQKAAAAFLERFRSEAKQFGGTTAWLALNAWTGYVQHDRRAIGKTDAEARESRLRSQLFGVGARRSQGAIVDAAMTFLAA
jgi:phage/plasmid-like protein (TIGR03299 family)